MKKEMVKLLVLGDLHGRIPEIKVDVKEIDIIVLPGDICGDEIRPCWQRVFALRKKGKDTKITDVCSSLKLFFLDIKSLIIGRKILHSLNKLEKPIVLVPGNWDQTGEESGEFGERNKFNFIKKGLKNIIDVNGIKFDLFGLRFIGHGSSSAPEDLTKQPLFKQRYLKLKKFSKVKKPLIFLSHNVPYNTKIDKINNLSSPVHNKHFGSKLARNLIDEVQPLLCIGGHIHEGYGRTRLKKTLCINAGFGSSVNTLVEIDVKEKKVVSTYFLGENQV